MAALLVIEGPEKGKRFALGESRLVMVGRDHSCTFQIVDPRLSRMHMQIKRDESSSGHLAIDFQSSNGVFVNDNRITAETPLKGGDVIRLGETSILYSTDDGPNADSAEEQLRRLRQGALKTQIGP